MTTRNSMAWRSLLPAIGIFILGAAALAQHQPTFITFNAPGAGSTPGSGLGTQGVDITPSGAITGMYSDANNVMHGFVRTPQGKLITFDASGAGDAGGGYFIPTPAGPYGGQGTYPLSMNPEGAIAGMSVDEFNLGHGFVRPPDGHFTIFDDPDVGTTPPQRTSPLDINPVGVTAGGYWDANSVYHGFVRPPEGKFTNFDPPGSVFTLVCVASCINPAGTVNGWYQDADGLVHGFVRDEEGAITEFDIPGAGTNGSLAQGTYSGSMNAGGTVTGDYVTEDNVSHGYIRTPDGHITKFDVPDAGTDGSQYQGTYAEAINDRGAVAGEYIDSYDVQHGFVRAPDGSITEFDAPGAGSDKGSYEGTIGLAINARGEITGAYFDSQYVLHGFLRLP